MTEDQKKNEFFTTSQMVAWLLLVAILIWIIFFLLSIPSISEYCEEGKIAWFGINIWENENCTRYWELKYETSKFEQEYNISIRFKNLNNQQAENITNSVGGACGLYSPINNLIIIRLNRTNCAPINTTITHELKHLKCDRLGQLGKNIDETHQGCFLNVTL